MFLRSSENSRKKYPSSEWYAFWVRAFNDGWLQSKEAYFNTMDEIAGELKNIAQKVNETKKGVGEYRINEVLERLEETINDLLTDDNGDSYNLSSDILLYYHYIMPSVYGYFEKKNGSDLEQIVKKANDEMKSVLDKYTKENPPKKKTRFEQDFEGILEKAFGKNNKGEDRKGYLETFAKKLAMAEWMWGPSITDTSEYPSSPDHVYRDMKWNFFKHDSILLFYTKEPIDDELNKIYILAKMKILECVHPALAKKVKEEAPEEFYDLVKNFNKEGDGKRNKSEKETEPKGGKNAQGFRQGCQCEPNIKNKGKDYIGDEDATTGYIVAVGVGEECK